MARTSQNPRLVAAALLAGAAVLFAIPVVAQVPDTLAGGQPITTSGEAAPALTLEEVEAALDAINKDSAIADAVKELLRQRYQQAIEALQAAADNSAKATSYREAIQSGPEKAVN
ncbi:MAG: hypothetical protein OES79_02090, partial [Planctomycetota bacterium]|nr:hypothetical protein [Planctomycetota bacterium]